jgi:hypothetical protein
MENLNLLLDAFGRHYQPAESIEESTDQLSTQEIKLLFETASSLPIETINESLQNAGYKLEMVDLRFVWLVKEKAG